MKGDDDCNLIYRAYLIEAYHRIYMYDDSIDITSTQWVDEFQNADSINLSIRGCGISSRYDHAHPDGT